MRSQPWTGVISRSSRPRDTAAYQASAGGTNAAERAAVDSPFAGASEKSTKSITARTRPWLGANRLRGEVGPSFSAPGVAARVQLPPVNAAAWAPGAANAMHARTPASIHPTNARGTCRPWRALDTG